MPDLATHPVDGGRDGRFSLKVDIGMARIKVHRKNLAEDKFVMTTVSVDSILFQLLLGKIGSQSAVCDWVQATVDSIAEATVRGDTLPPTDVCAGLSRLVQRQAFRLLFAGRTV